MKWYSKHIGDYQTATAHLTMLEHGAYNMMLDHYYATERQLPKDIEALKHIFRVKSAAETAAIQRILKEFFTASAEGWSHNKVEQELARSHGISEKRANAGRRGAMTTNRNRPAIAEKQAEKPKSAIADQASAVPGSASGSAALATATATVKQDQTHSPADAGPPTAIAEQSANQKRAQAKIIATAALDYLNAKAGKKFRQGDATLKFGIDRVLYDSATLADLCAVVDLNLARVEAGKLERMYLRPETMWNKTKFASYIGEVGAAAPAAQAKASAPQLVRILRLSDDGNERVVTETYVAAAITLQAFNFEQVAKRAYAQFRTYIEKGGNTTVIVEFAKERRTFKTAELQ